MNQPHDRFHHQPPPERHSMEPPSSRHSAASPSYSNKNDFPQLGKKSSPPPPPPPPTVAPVIALPGEDEATARARIEKKKKEKLEAEAAAREQAAKEEAARIAREQAAKEEAERLASVEEDLLSRFASGDMMGGDLKRWCEEQAVLPSVEKLVARILTEREKKNPDIECGWAMKETFGEALLSLVEDDTGKQMEVLWAIQKYCDGIGFPKIDDEYLVQGMFRSMYKYDLTLDDAFSEWKDDESEEHETGKVKAIIQTVEWFNWLEEDDDSEEEYEDDDEPIEYDE